MNDIIKLNVGGRLFTTSRLTLIQYPDSLLAKMFDPDLSMDAAKKDESGAYFIDRSPKVFEVVLEFLRTGRYFHGNDYETLLDEAEYFGLDNLIAIICQSAKDDVWFNISGKRIPISLRSDANDQYNQNLSDFLYKLNSSMSIPRDIYGAYTFYRDAQMFSVIRTYLLNNKYPMGIDHRVVRDEALCYGIESLFKESLQYFTKRFVVLDKDKQFMGAGVVELGKSVRISIVYDQVRGDITEKTFTISEMTLEDEPMTSGDAWICFVPTSPTSLYKCLEHKGLADKKVVWLAEKESYKHLYNAEYEEPFGSVPEQFKENSKFWTTHDAFLGVPNISEVTQMK